MYMRGDYGGGRGDYMRGDPGIFSAIGGFVKKAAGFAAGSLIPGGQAIISAIGALSSHHSSGGNPSNLPAIQAARMGMGPPDIGVDTGVPEVMAGGAGGAATIPAFQSTIGPGGRRVHPNKSAYVTRGGGTSKYAHTLLLHLKNSILVPNRRMNVANPRALRRSLRRVAGFAKLTKRVRRAVSLAASAVGVHRGHRGKAVRRR
jgi:hypothetical protein